MTRSVFVSLVIALAVALMATAATAHEGYSHGSKAKKVKKPKAKQAAIVYRLVRPATQSAVDRSQMQKNMQLSGRA